MNSFIFLLIINNLFDNKKKDEKDPCAVVYCIKGMFVFLCACVSRYISFRCVFTNPPLCVLIYMCSCMFQGGDFYATLVTLIPSLFRDLGNLFILLFMLFFSFINLSFSFAQKFFQSFPFLHIFHQTQGVKDIDLSICVC